MHPQGVPEGIDRGRLEAWLVDHVGSITPPLAFERIPGGRSNLTFVVTDSGDRRVVLRRPPLHSRLPSAHDMGREHRIQAALGPTRVPVPAMLGHCDDESVIGAPFYVMAYVDGVTVGDPLAAAPLTAPARHAASLDLVDVLATLHHVDPDEVGLGDLSRRDGYIERQLRRWSQQWEAQKTRELPAMDEAHDALAAQVPEQTSVRIVHGDYRLDNVRLSAGGEVRAVLDWELATLGDPLADVGTLLAYWARPDDDVVALPGAPSLEPGFATRDELAERYRAATGTRGDLDFYVAFACWRIAAILEGVLARTRAGAYGEGDEQEPIDASLVDRLAETARRLVT